MAGRTDHSQLGSNADVADRGVRAHGVHFEYRSKRYSENRVAAIDNARMIRAVIMSQPKEIGSPTKRSASLFNQNDAGIIAPVPTRHIEPYRRKRCLLRFDRGLR